MSDGYKTVKGKKVKVSVDATGGVVSVDWTCPLQRGILFLRGR